MSNPFALLAGDDDAGSDAGDVLPKQSRPVQVDAAPAKTASGASAPKSGKLPNATTKRFIPGQSTRPQKQVNELPASDAPAGSQAQFEGERGRDDRGTGFQRGGRGGRGRGGERGRGGRGGARGGPRQERPDRRSQTGREDSHKAEHQGWGGDDGKRELQAENEGLGDAATEAKASGEGETPAEGAEAAQVNGDKAEAEPATPAEPEDNSQTYEEYLKSRADRLNISGVEQLAARKANEGSDDSQWKDGVRVEKTDDEYFAASAKERAAKSKQRKEKTFLEVEFAPPARQERGGDRGGRGGRGRGRGDGDRPARGAGRGAPRGRGGPSRGRGGASNNANIALDDSKAFPSLA